MKRSPEIDYSYRPASSWENGTPALNPYRERLLGSFAQSVSAEGTTMIVCTHPNAPTLLLSRNLRTLPQVVPVLLAGSLFGGEAANVRLGRALSQANSEWFPLFQCVTDGKGFCGVIAPYLFYRAPETGSFSAAAKAACEEVAKTGLLTDWCIVLCGISYLTKDGKSHRVENYPQALKEDRL